MLLIIAVSGMIAYAILGNGPSSISIVITGQKMPAQSYANLSKAFNNTPDIEINYSISLPLLSSSSYLTGLNQSIPLQLIKSGSDTKVLMSISTATIAIYHEQGINIMCTEFSGYSLFGTSGISCELLNSTAGSSFGLFNTSAISRIAGAFNQTLRSNGTLTISGRTCENFVNVINSSRINKFMSILNLSSYLGSISMLSGGKLHIDQCLDSQYGYPAYLNVTQISHSVLSGQNTSSVILVMKSTGYSTNVDSSLLKIPINFTIDSMTCNSTVTNLNFTSLTDSSNATVKVALNSSPGSYTYPYNYSKYFGSASAGSELEFGQHYFLKIPMKHRRSAVPQINGSSFYANADICVGGSCQNTSCYYYAPFNFSYSRDIAAPPNVTQLRPSLNLTFVAYGSDHPSLNNKQNNPKNTSKLDGIYGNLTTMDPWIGDDEGANWTWDFGYVRTGNFTATWYANDSTINNANCGMYPTDFEVNWYASSTGSADNWTLFSTHTFSNYSSCGSSASPIVNTVNGSYRYIRVNQYSAVYGMVCPGITYVDSVTHSD